MIADRSLAVMPQAPVVISGLGLLTNAGAGKDAFAAAMRSGASRLTEVDRSSYHRGGGGASLAAQVDGAGFASILPPARARRMSRPSRFAVVAALEAVAERDQAGEVAWQDAATFVGTCYGPSAYTEGLLRQTAQEGPQAASPVLFIESVANAAAAQIALRFGCLGANLTITQREASAVLAVAQAARSVAIGDSARALCGAVEEVNPLLHSVLDRYGALARQRRAFPEQARPFEASRNGFVVAEGAMILSLEQERLAPLRLARVLGWVRAFDPSAPATSWGTGARRLASSLREGLARFGCDFRSIDLVVSGANGSPAADRLEAEVLRGLWQQELPPILVPKAISGEFGGSPIATAVLACAGIDLGPGLSESAQKGLLDPALKLTEVPPASAGQIPRRVLVSALAVGGAAAWLVLESCSS